MNFADTTASIAATLNWLKLVKTAATKFAPKSNVTAESVEAMNISRTEISRIEKHWELIFFGQNVFLEIVVREESIRNSAMGKYLRHRNDCFLTDRRFASGRLSLPCSELDRYIWYLTRPCWMLVKQITFLNWNNSPIFASNFLSTQVSKFFLLNRSQFPRHACFAHSRQTWAGKHSVAQCIV